MARNYSDFVPRCTITAVPVILYRCTLYTCTLVPAGGGLLPVVYTAVPVLLCTQYTCTYSCTPGGGGAPGGVHHMYTVVPVLLCTLYTCTLVPPGMLVYTVHVYSVPLSSDYCCTLVHTCVNLAGWLAQLTSAV